MKILIAAYPRSGTQFVAKHLQTKGIIIGHEQLLEHGASSWCHIVGEGLFGRRKEELKDVKYDLIIHLIRNPLHSISSAMTIKQASLKQMFRHIGDPPKSSKLYQVMWSYHHWNKLIESKAHLTMRVEHIRSKIPPRNKRKHENLTWEMLENEDRELAQLIKNTWGKS